MGKPAGPGQGCPAQRPRVKAVLNLSRKAQNLKGKMIAQYARRESTLKPEAKDGSPRYSSRRSSFQVHGGSPTGQNNSRYQIPKYPICTQAEAGRLFRKYKGGEETQKQLSILQHFGQFAAQFVLSHPPALVDAATRLPAPPRQRAAAASAVIAVTTVTAVIAVVGAVAP